jgi:hypothetical protein
VGVRMERSDVLKVSMTHELLWMVGNKGDIELCKHLKEEIQSFELKEGKGWIKVTIT